MKKGIIETRDVSVNFVNGKPQAVESHLYYEKFLRLG